MMTVEQVKAKLRRGKSVYGKLLTSADGQEWIRVTLSSKAELDYYLGRTMCYGIILD